jgi:signal transduction histidine kinase
MQKTRVIVAAWLLLLVPTLLIGLGSLRLLRHEGERLAGSARAAAEERARGVVESMELSVTEVREGLLDTLRALPAEGLAGRLEAWKDENPLIRNVFVWAPGEGIVFPPPESPGNAEEASFLRRYDDLFSGGVPWQPPLLEQTAAAQTAAENLYSERRALRDLALQRPAAPASSSSLASLSAPAAKPEKTGGWLPWFSGNRVSLLGWIEESPGGRRYGLEVEMMALLSRLVSALPPTPPAGETYALLDDTGGVFQQSGPGIIDGSTQPLTAVAAGSALPHWQLAVYRDGEGGGAGGSFFLLSALLVGAFVAAIIFGGSLLLWQAWRHQRDARMKTSFVANVSHELRTPLTTIRMYAELLGEGTIRSQEKRRHYLQVIIGESARLSRLVANVLEFSRLEQGRKRYLPEDLDLPAHLHGILDAQQMRLAEAGMTLVRHIPPPPLTLKIDRDALEQVLLNLIDNAIKYAADGKVLVVELSAAKNGCRIRIADSGPGIPTAQRKRIFDKFHRVDDSLTARQPGSGLGLSIARQLLLDQGGELICCAAEIGACFEITLPAPGALV